MTDAVADRVRRWDLSGAQTTTGELFNQVHERIGFLQTFHFDQYLPTIGPDQVTDFEERLEQWLSNSLSEPDQQLLLELVPHLVFIGREEFAKLYQAALRGPITRWLVELLNLDFLDPDLQTTLGEQIHRRTWYCALSDSMQISDFCHVNQIGGIDYRPDFRTLNQFGDPTRILEFMASPSNPSRRLERIVILEDFIGSGTQFQDAHAILDTLLAAGVPILVVPLLLCPDGAACLKGLFPGRPFRLEPVLSLRSELFINQATPDSPTTLFGQLKDMLLRSYHLVVGNNSARPRPYSPFGFGHTGGLVVLYSNTPANTLPVIQHSSNTWTPLFPRSARVK